MRDYLIAPATSDNVGNWDGEEQLAARNFNRLQNALVEALHDDEASDPEATVRSAVDRAWDVWGSREDLLTLTDAQIAEYIASVVGNA